MSDTNRTDCLNRLRNAGRIVIKVGTSLLTSSDGINMEMIHRLRDEILFLRAKGIRTILVSSGAVGMGREILKKFNKNFKDSYGSDNEAITRKQALSAMGQSKLMSVYARVFADVGIPVAQLLLTARDFRDRRAYLNIGHAMEALIDIDALPVINENDTVSTEELRFGDNDLLSAACTSLFRADALFILTGVEGFLVNGSRVSFISKVTPEHFLHAGGPAGPGSGGMLTKLRAGQLCSMSGEILAILPGRHEHPVQSLFAGEDIGTLICSGDPARKLSARKRWLLYTRTRGSVVVDDGAAVALIQKGSSLLPAGITSVTGEFMTGDIIEIEDKNGNTIGRGITAYSKRELEKMIRTKSEMDHKNGHNKADAVIHRNDLILEDLPGLRKFT